MVSSDPVAPTSTTVTSAFTPASQPSASVKSLSASGVMNMMTSEREEIPSCRPIEPDALL